MDGKGRTEGLGGKGSSSLIRVVLDPPPLGWPGSELVPNRRIVVSGESHSDSSGAEEEETRRSEAVGPLSRDREDGAHCADASQSLSTDFDMSALGEPHHDAQCSLVHSYRGGRRTQVGPGRCCQERDKQTWSLRRLTRRREGKGREVFRMGRSRRDQWRERNR